MPDKVLIDERLFIEWTDAPDGKVVVVDGKHRGQVGTVLSLESYYESTGNINLKVAGEECEFSGKEVQPLLPKVYAFSCKYDGGDDDASKARNCESAEIVQKIIIGNLTGSGMAEYQTGKPGQDQMFSEGAAEKFGTIDAVPIPQHPKATLIWNPNHFHLNWGATSPEGDCRFDGCGEDCNEDTTKDCVCASFQRGEKPPCWRSNYYAALNKHKALLQIVEHGKLGLGQTTEVRMAQRLGIIPAEFDDAANLASRATYVSPSLRFIRIHTSPAGETKGFKGSAAQNNCSAAFSCLCCPCWCICACCCCTDLKAKLFPDSNDATRGNMEEIIAKLNETPLGRKGPLHF